MKTIVCIIPTAGLPKGLSNLVRSTASVSRATIRGINVKTVVTTTNPNPIIGKAKHIIDHVYIAPIQSGFGDMNNYAIKKIKAVFRPDYYLFLNDDAWIEPSFFREFLKSSNGDNSDIFIPLIYKGTSTAIDSFGIEYFTSGYARNATQKSFPTSLATAACLLVKNSIIEKLQKKYGFVFNPLLHYYIEDVELSIRIRAVGAIFKKEDRMRARHLGSFTSRGKSYFTLFYSFRNTLWVIFMTWPAPIILTHSVKIFVVFSWLFLTSHFYGKPLMFFQIFIDTLKHTRELTKARQNIVNKYPSSFQFKKLFSPHMFRTRMRGIPL